MDLDGPYLFVLDQKYLQKFEDWYHQVGGECSYMIHAIAGRLGEFESSSGTRIAFYWSADVASGNRQGRYVLDASGIQPANQ